MRFIIYLHKKDKIAECRGLRVIFVEKASTSFLDKILENLDPEYIIQIL